MWAVAILAEGDEAEVVPHSWLNSRKSEVFLPPYYSPKRIMKAIKNKESVDVNTWTVCPVRILSQCKSYKEATKRAKEVEAVSKVGKTRPLIDRHDRMSKRTLVNKHSDKVEGLEATVPKKQMRSTKPLQLSQSPPSQQPVLTKRRLHSSLLAINSASSSSSAQTADEFGSNIQQCSSTELAQHKRQDQGNYECEVLPEETGVLQQWKFGSNIQQCSSTELAQHKRQDQGNYECEVLAEATEAVKQWNECKKNPGHAKFIPVTKFSLNHLGLERQHNLVFKCVKSIAKLTVRVVVHYTSAKRPKRSAFYNSKGQKQIPHYGSGYVGCNFTQNDVEEKTAKKTCPCPECVKSTNPKTVWWSCKVITARHVVYNAEEANNTVFEAFYDDDESHTTVKKLYGYKMYRPKTEEDICEVFCATHDNEVCKKLDKAIAKIDKYRLKFGCSEEYQNENDHLCVVVSHPHGRSKYVSIGRWKMFKQKEGRRYQEEDNLRIYTSPSAFQYTTPTCKGSSGAPVFVIDLLAGRWFNFVRSDCDWHTHSEGTVKKNGENLNKCSFNAVHGW